MSVTLERDRNLFQAEEKNARASGDTANEFPKDGFSMARGMVNGLAAGLIFWAVTIYLLMK